MTVRARLSAGRTILADGALGSLLLARGLQPGQPPEVFVLDRPEVLEEIVRLYQASGAEIFQANTFGANPLNLARYGLQDRASEINHRAVEIVRQVSGTRGYVWASIGPSGRLLKPYGETEPDDVYAGYLVQAKALVEAQPDLIAVETMTDLREALLAVRAVRAVSRDIPLVATMTFEKRPKGYFTAMGNSVAEAASALAQAGSDVIGSNCGYGIRNMIEVARAFRGVTRLPLAIRPNAGLPELRDGVAIYPESPEYMARRLPELLAVGIAILGGCCGTTPAHVKAFRQVLGAQSQ